MQEKSPRKRAGRGSNDQSIDRSNIRSNGAPATPSILRAAPPAAPGAGPGIDTGLTPLHDPRARLLILGSFPGRASLGAQQYYAHPRNLFWSIVGSLCGDGIDLAAAPYTERLAALERHRIALWDVIARCERPGSLDGSIRAAQLQSFESLLAKLPALEAVAFNGRLAAKQAPWFDARGYRCHLLPSTSPANAGTPERVKREAWSVLAPLCRPIRDLDKLSDPGDATRPRARRPAPG